MPANCTPLVQVVTPPPDDRREWSRPPTWAKTTSTSPTVCGDTARVVRPVPTVELKVPTAVIDRAGTVKVKWSAGRWPARCPPAAVTVTSTVPADSAGEVTVIEVDELTTTPVPATVPNFTPVTPVKPVPVMVTGVPPAVGPGVGADAGDRGRGRGGEGELVGGAGGARGAPRPR